MPKFFTVNLHAQKNKIIKGTMFILLFLLTVIVVKPAAETVFKTTSAASGTKRKLPIYSVDTAEKKVALTFDAAWGADDTDSLLEILKTDNIKATFFLCGYWIDKYPDEVKKIYEAGHDIGNHGNTHAHGAQLSLEQNKQEVLGVHNKIRNLLGIEINLFRPPFGEYNNTVIEAADSLDYYTIQWDVDTLDTKIEVIWKPVKSVLPNHFYLIVVKINFANQPSRNIPFNFNVRLTPPTDIWHIYISRRYYLRIHFS